MEVTRSSGSKAALLPEGSIQTSSPTSSWTRSDGLLGKGQIKPISLFQMQNPQRLCPFLRHKSSPSAGSPNHPQSQQCTGGAAAWKHHGVGTRDSFQGMEDTSKNASTELKQIAWLQLLKVGREGNLLMEMSNTQMSSLRSPSTNCPAYILRGTWVPCPQNSWFGHQRNAVNNLCPSETTPYTLIQRDTSLWVLHTLAQGAHTHSS